MNFLNRWLIAVASVAFLFASPALAQFFYSDALCDGSTNDVAAINSAIVAANSAGAGTVWLASKTGAACIFGGSQIILKSNVTLACAPGTTLKLLSSYNNWTIQSDIIIDKGSIIGCTFDMGNFFPASYVGVAIFGNAATNVSFDNNWIINKGKAGVAFQGATNYSFKNNYCSSAAARSVVLTVTSKTNNGGLVRLGVNSTSEIGTNFYGLVQNVSADANAGIGGAYAGVSIVTVIDDTHLDLQGSTFNAGTPYNGSGGTVTFNTQDECLNVTAALQNSNGDISYNTFDKSCMDITTKDTIFAYNKGSGWKFGGCLTVGDATKSYNNRYIGNEFTDSSGVDINGVFPSGIENDAPYSISSANVVKNNSGCGIIDAGDWTIHSGDFAQDNGQWSGGGGSGFCTQDISVALSNGRNQTWTGTTSFNTTGAAGTQEYAYTAYSTVTGTNFGTNTWQTGSLGIIDPASGGVTTATAKIPTALVAFLKSTTSSSLVGAVSSDFDSTGKAAEIVYSGNSVSGNLFGSVAKANLGWVNFQNTSGGAIYSNTNTPIYIAPNGILRGQFDSNGFTATGADSTTVINVRSGNVAKYAALSIGRNITEGYLGVTSGTQFFAETAPGDIVFQAASRTLWMGVGGGAPGRVSVTPGGAFTVYDGGLVIGAPIGGNKGIGTANFAGAIYANGTIGVTCSAGFSASTGRSVLGIVTAC